MSVNITVNEKFIKNCSKHNLLDDPERVKKEIENERRKLRIQQVRDVSRKIAKKVRANVENEKERQLKIIEQIKQQEMEMWRQNVLDQKQKDFRSAIFQIGTAHRAAQAENVRQISPKKKKKQLKCYNNKVGKENILKDVNVQTDITGNCYPKAAPVKYKNMTAHHSLPKPKGQQKEKSFNFENNSNCLETDYSTDFSQSSILSASDTNDPSENKLPKQKSNTKLQNSPHILEDNNPETDSSLIAIPNIDDYKESKKKNCKLDKEVELKLTNEEPSTGPFKTSTKKRFTQISDIIRLQKSSDETECEPTTSLQHPGTSHDSRSPTKPNSKHPLALKKQTPTKLVPKSPVVSKSPSTSTQVAKSNSSSRTTATRVQFYDYNNKFEKQYDHPVSAVEIHYPKTDRSNMNAMEQAALSDQLREAREAKMEKLRQKSTQRCEKAMEREQVRRACEELTAKLDAITIQRPALPSDNYQFASYRLARIAKEKEVKLTNAVEDLLSRPAVITCPVVDRLQSGFPASENRPSRTTNIGLNLGSELTCNDNNTLNSSDSCCSILLGYVNGESKQIADDIQKYKKQSGETEKAKVEKLQDLLNKINCLRVNLMKEIEKCTSSDLTDKEGVKLMMDSINQLRKERENIMTTDLFKDSLSKRESDLKKKEEVLEKKLREFYEIQKTAKKKEKSKVTKEDLENLPCQEKQNKTKSDNFLQPTHIENKSQNKTRSESIQKNEESNTRIRDNHYQKEKRQDSKGPEREPSSDEELDSDEFVGQKKLLVDLKPLEIIIKVKGDSKNLRKARNIIAKSPRKLSTLIQSPTPKKSRRKFTTVQSIDSNSTSYRSLPSLIHNNVDKVLKNDPTTSKVSALKNTQTQLPNVEIKQKLKKTSSNLNPLMAHYVQRLLGMSRNSINALEVTSSDIETPSSSIINNTANLSAAETEQLASSRLEHVQRFIEDNYSFIGELEQSLLNSNSTDSSQKAIEIAWQKALNEDKRKKNDAQVKKPLKPSLKKTSKKQKNNFNEAKQPIAPVDKSTQKTDNCTQRIAELTEMINKVRKEKQKILETTLSSVSETGRNSTEYLDLPGRRDNSEELTSKILDTQLVKSIDNSLPIHSPEMAQLLEKHKSTGMSRDSGISLSRPITVQESRDSPIQDKQQAQLSTESLSAQIKKPKPPISIARYSPQLPEDIPHELSTIFEVDTPATSRLNTSVHARNGQDNPSNIQLKDNSTEKIAYRQFPSFEEYVKINQLDMSQFNPEFSVQFEKEFNEFINLAKQGKVLDYEEFTSFSKYLTKSSSSENKETAEELFASLKKANMSFKMFPTRKEYLDKIGVSNSDLLDSQSLDNMEESRNIFSSSSSSSSLMNVENELMLRKILTKSFQQNRQSNDDKAKSLNSTSTLVSQNKQQGEITGIKQFTTGSTSMDEQSDDLENDLKRMGIKWPSVMKKKTMETQALSSSTSSNFEPSAPSRRKPATHLSQPVETSFQKETNSAYDRTTHTEDGGQQLNLREFLKKELLKRTTASSSFSFSDDSVASSILRSIIGSITSSSQPQEVNGAGGPTLDRHKTSTPMASQSVSSTKVVSKSQGGTSSIQLFSGESRLSSVHFNNSSKDINKSADINKDADAKA